MHTHPKIGAKLWTVAVTASGLRAVPVKIVDIDWLSGQAVGRWTRSPGDEVELKRFPGGFLSSRQGAEKLALKFANGGWEPSPDGEQVKFW